MELVMETLGVARTARYATSGPREDPHEIWILLHGYGQLATDLAEACDSLVHPERLLVFPEGLSHFYVDGSIGRVGASWMTRVGREDEIADYLAYLDALRACLPAAPTTMLGFSQGSATAFRHAVHGEAPIRRLVSWAGDVPPDLDLAAASARLSELELVLVCGTRDHFITPDRLAAEQARLEAAGIPYRFLGFDGGHRLDRDTLKTLAG